MTEIRRVCNGSGEGQTEHSRCYTCKGKREVYTFTSEEDKIADYLYEQEEDHKLMEGNL